jgi:hypothetical protein
MNFSDTVHLVYKGMPSFFPCSILFQICWGAMERMDWLASCFIGCCIQHGVVLPLRQQCCFRFRQCLYLACCIVVSLWLQSCMSVVYDLHLLSTYGVAPCLFKLCKVRHSWDAALALWSDYYLHFRALKVILICDMLSWELNLHLLLICD